MIRLLPLRSGGDQEGVLAQIDLAVNRIRVGPFPFSRPSCYNGIA